MISIGANSAHANDDQIPIEGSYSGTARFSDNSSNVVLFEGTGIATHLGQGTIQGQAVITGSDNSCSGGLANVNYETVIGANGDSFTLASVGVACPTTTGQFHGTGQWTLIGGTGRFSGATGQGILDGYADFNQNVFIFDLTGTISAPNGGRRNREVERLAIDAQGGPNLHRRERRLGSPPKGQRATPGGR